MQVVRTIIWVLTLFALLAFSFFNWKPVEVTLWENLVLETKVPALVLIAFLAGLVPMWGYHRSVKWSLQRRIRSLENAARSNALQRRHEPAAPPPVADHAADRPADNPVDNSGDQTAKPVDALAPAAADPTPNDPAP